jgi:uncharacterized repeat protein (TIGR03987 family)
MILLFAIVSVFLALIFYSGSILRELVKKEVTRNILILFWLGLFFDVAGTILMFNISKGFSLSLHSVIALIALFLMGIKAVWSLVNYRAGLGRRVPTVYIMFAWILWLSVFVLGFFIV